MRVSVEAVALALVDEEQIEVRRVPHLAGAHLSQRQHGEIDARLRNNRGIDNVSLSTLSSYALRLAQSQGRLEWVRWVIDLFKAHGAMFSAELVDWVENSSPPFRQAIHADVATYLDWWRATHGTRASENDRARAQRLATAIDD